MINYETAVIETILPERHVFMGNTWFYGKIVSLFGDGASICGKGNISRMMKFMMISSMFENSGTSSGEGSTVTAAGGMNANMLMPLLLMKGGGFDDLFGNLFEEDGDDEEESDDTDV